jgi:hypothetical protein
MKFKYFSEKEIMNPVFDDNPYPNWESMPKKVQKNLQETLLFLDWVREQYGEPLKINSTFRIHDKKGKAHRGGYAIDFVPVMRKNWWARDIIEIVKDQNIFPNFRLFWEWSGYKDGWIHIDRGYRDDGKKKFYVAYPKGKKMIYKIYESLPPWYYVGINVYG